MITETIAYVYIHKGSHTIYAHSSQQGTTNWLLRCTTQILQSNRGEVASTKLPTQNSPMIKGMLYNHIYVVVGTRVQILHAVRTMPQLGVSCGMADETTA